MALEIHQKCRRRHGACALSLRTVNKWTVDRETEHKKKKMKMASARKSECLCGPLMRSNCCCDSHSTTRRVSCKKGSICSAAWTWASSPPLLLLLWDVAGFRVRRQEGWGDGVIVSESMQIRHPHRNGRAAFSDFSTLGPVFKKVRFQPLCFQDLCGRSAKTMQYICVFRKRAFSSGRGLILNPWLTLGSIVFCRLPRVILLRRLCFILEALETLQRLYTFSLDILFHWGLQEHISVWFYPEEVFVVLLSK